MLQHSCAVVVVQQQCVCVCVCVCAECSCKKKMQLMNTEICYIVSRSVRLKGHVLVLQTHASANTINPKDCWPHDAAIVTGSSTMHAASCAAHQAGVTHLSRATRSRSDITTRVPLSIDCGATKCSVGPLPTAIADTTATAVTMPSMVQEHHWRNKCKKTIILLLKSLFCSLRNF